MKLILFDSNKYSRKSNLDSLYNLDKDNIEKLDWNYISKNRKLKKSFMVDYFYYLNKNYICIYQDLPEEFIEEKIHYLNINLIIKYQELSVYFLIKYKHKLNWDLVLKYQIKDLLE